MIYLIIAFAIVLGCILVFRVIETLNYFSEWRRLSPGEERRTATANLIIHIIVCIVLMVLMILSGAALFFVNR